MKMEYRRLSISDINSNIGLQVKRDLLKLLKSCKIKSGDSFGFNTTSKFINGVLRYYLNIDNDFYYCDTVKIKTDSNVDLADQIDDILEQYFAAKGDFGFRINREILLSLIKYSLDNNYLYSQIKSDLECLLYKTGVTSGDSFKLKTNYAVNEKLVRYEMLIDHHSYYDDSVEIKTDSDLEIFKQLDSIIEQCPDISQILTLK